MGSKPAEEKPSASEQKDQKTHTQENPEPKLTVETGNTDKKKGSSSGIASGATTPTPTSGGGIDAHPYARGSVIEVLHGVKEESEDHWLSSSSEEEEEEEGDKTGKETSSLIEPTVRLCDVIDRAGDGKNGKWRYYVHYRDFNRRMDEWIGMDRIVSPPSVGNKKARELKKQEERQKRKQARLEERNAELATAAKLSAPRASRRRASNMGSSNPASVASSTAADATSGPPTSTAATTAAGEPTSGVDPAPETPRITRRRKTTEADKGTTSTGDAADGQPALAAEKEVVPINTTAAAVETTIGEHVVATIPAQEMDEHEGLDEASLREHEEVTKVKNVSFLELGPHRMETWYFSPLPRELFSEKAVNIEVLYVCEFSLHMFPRKTELLRYQARQLPKNQRHPPGNEIYRNGNLSMFEVDGFEERIYCQNLCYIAKLFLDHKTLYFDVDPFLFYVLCEVDNRGYHPVGYFSKEKYSDVGYNLACILTFPSHQRKGYGRFLIAFSYELSKKEEKVGSPEKPMSDLGQQAYKPYWMSTIIDFLYKQESEASSMSIMDISKKTSIMAEDIVFTLNQLGILKIINGVYFIAAEEGLLERLAKKHPVKKPRVDASKLHWTPFLTDVKRDKFSVHSKKQSVEGDEARGPGGF